MSEVRVKMHQTFASPEHILQAGKTYVVPAELAAALTAPDSGGPSGTPAAEIVRGVKAARPGKPDPGEKLADEHEDAE